jgi:hypothetical protein
VRLYSEVGITLLEGSQVANACPSDKGSVTLRWLEVAASHRVEGKKGKAIPVQAVNGHRVVRRRGSHSF